MNRTLLRRKQWYENYFFRERLGMLAQLIEPMPSIYD